MATGVEELLDMLYELIDEAKSVPLSNEKCIIERDKAGVAFGDVQDKAVLQGGGRPREDLLFDCGQSKQ